MTLITANCDGLDYSVLSLNFLAQSFLCNLSLLFKFKHCRCSTNILNASLVCVLYSEWYSRIMRQ